MLYGLNYLNGDSRNLYETGYFIRNLNWTDMILEAIKELIAQIRPVALNILESFEIPDSVLISAVGNSYGDIYEQHLEWA